VVPVLGLGTSPPFGTGLTFLDTTTGFVWREADATSAAPVFDFTAANAALWYPIGGPSATYVSFNTPIPARTTFLLTLGPPGLPLGGQATTWVLADDAASVNATSSLVRCPVGTNIPCLLALGGGFNLIPISSLRLVTSQTTIPLPYLPPLHPEYAP
jgi:hypothetical protein